MVSKRKESKAMVACVVILVLSTLVFMIVAWGAGKRNKPETIPETGSETKLEEPLGGSKPVPEETSQRETEKEAETPKKDTVVENEPEEIIPTVVTVDDIDFTLPADGGVLVGCSVDSPVYSMTMNDYRTHNGVDISASSGESVYACAAGVVKNIYEDPMMGMTVVLSHAEGIESVYRNLDLEIADGITVGSPVAAGQVIGAVGETALVECEEESHLHFELVVNGENVDPTEYIEIANISDVYED